MAKEVWTIDQIVANLDRWHAGWPGGEVAYTFLTAPPPGSGNTDYEGFAAFNAEQMAGVRLAFALLSDVANLTFVEQPDTGTTDYRMTFANSDTVEDYVWGYASPAWSWNSTRNQIYTAEVVINSDYGLDAYQPGGYNLSSMMHEIMHALGVPHPGEYNADGSDITYENSAEYAQDSSQYTLMSYFSAEDTGASHGYNFAWTPLLHDVLILQHIYGANMETRTGNTVYGFNSNADRDVFKFTANSKPIVAIWDAGGTDKIDLSGYATNSILDLREGGFSSFGGLTLNMAIAYGAVIENATTGAGADTIYGNAAVNIIDGGLGADTMAGGAGGDRYYVDNAGDKVIEAKVTGDDHVLSSVSFSLAGQYVERLTLTGSAAINATGNSLANTLTGNGANNVLDGSSGADRMVGGAGSDTYYVDNKGDRIVEAKVTGTDQVYSTVTFDMSGQYIENATLTGSANVFLKGNSLGNILVGNTGNNVLNGGAGGDRLTGGAGADRFVWDALADSSVSKSDRITDLSSSDIIDLSRLDANSGVAGDQAFALVSAFSGKAGQATLTFANGATFLNLDVNGDRQSDMMVRLDGDHRGFDNFVF